MPQFLRLSSTKSDQNSQVHYPLEVLFFHSYSNRHITGRYIYILASVKKYSYSTKDKLSHFRQGTVTYCMCNILTDKTFQALQRYRQTPTNHKQLHLQSNFTIFTHQNQRTHWHKSCVIQQELALLIINSCHNFQ